MQSKTEKRSPKAKSSPSATPSTPSDSSRATSSRRTQPHTFGHKYWLYLADAVDAPEYIMQWGAFVSLAAAYGRELIYREDFHTIYEREQEPTEFRQLLTSMKVVDSRGKSALDQDQWDAANLYFCFAFKKLLPAPALNGSGASAGKGS